ncbi:hypothetical protein CB0940_09843 [Cercospora beticola]|uniref:Uncharacterized protein n=1 Tax=Cercospora beticola TaxID=122368 RepID=A0A2G5HIC8_CERBT|nr:hypothetical protein CB0940_09843 [Cercospora beticola]PIA92317.1 hypothetical protein CB0940_09843 [Cercospora beticola]WPB05811.1 hypothetical protein RHO25_010465 [Cercospora beticola]
METISPKTLERLFRTRSLSSDTLHSLLTPTVHEGEDGVSCDTTQLVTSPQTTETSLELLRRLRAPDAELIRVQCTRDVSERPLLISRSLLEHASPLFVTKLRYHDTLVLDTNVFVYAIFIYWLYHERVPEPGDFNGDWSKPLTEHERGEFQVLLVSSWTFAEQWHVPRLQNAIIDALFDTFTTGETVAPDVMESCLKISRKESAMRFALMFYMLWSDNIKQQQDTGSSEEGMKLLVDTVDIGEVAGFDDDFMLATEVLVWREREALALGEFVDGEMPKAEKFYVPVE